MSEKTIKWVLFAALCGGMPILVFAFVIAALVPISGLPAFFLYDPDFATAILCLVHLAIYGALFYLLAWGASKALALLPTLVRLLFVALFVVGMLTLTQLPVYGFCLNGCDQMPLVEFYNRSAGAT